MQYQQEYINNNTINRIHMSYSGIVLIKSYVATSKPNTGLIKQIMQCSHFISLYHPLSYKIKIQFKLAWYATPKYSTLYESKQGIVSDVSYSVVNYIDLHEVSYFALIFTLSVS